MSYILDALRRADAERERERGAVPDLHAHPMVDIGAPPPSTRRRPAVLPWVAGGLGALLLAGLVVWLLADPGREPEMALAPPPPAPALEAAPAAPAAPPAATTDRAMPGDEPAEGVESLPPLHATPRPPPDRAARSAAATRPAAAESPRATTAEATGSPPGNASARTPAAGSAASAPKVYQLQELPPEIRADAPRFAFGGSMYSDDPASRMLIINGQVLRENDAIGPNLRLVQIRARSAVFEYKGYRYELPF